MQSRFEEAIIFKQEKPELMTSEETWEIFRPRPIFSKEWRLQLELALNLSK